ncbi:MrcB family domain-containing protein [Paracoccus zeaxanthinifaciens]|uniref:MrcB family domain-containing protein n=1 Tax=Paracoccus zeaxanthinifaciens TaxID=187400 RepID=UPI0003B49B07|nr:DUF3578 domain-containing protein [Paracoccus zeaxanthinifaciens]
MSHHAAAIRGPIGASPYAARFRRDLPLAAAALLPPDTSLLCRASPGARGWAAVPWLACFAPRITRSMKRGVYVALFIRPIPGLVTLALQHGAEDLLDRHGLQGGLSALSQRAERLRAITGPLPDMRPGPSDLGAVAPLPRGYQAGTIWYRDLAPTGAADAFSALTARYASMVDAGMF